MREIKFRAWATAEKKMFLPVYFDNLEVHWWSEDDGQLVIIGDVKENSMLHQAIIMQFTGLKDKNYLTDVYEGDIIDKNGLIKGNIYEITEDKIHEGGKMDGSGIDIVVTNMGERAWRNTEQALLERGCQYSK